MNRKKRKTNMLTMLFFAIGLVMYLTGIVLLFCSSLKNLPLLKAFFSNVTLSNNMVNSMKLVGGLLFSKSILSVAPIGKLIIDKNISSKGILFIQLKF